MDEARFWAIIEAGGTRALADLERQLAAVCKQLRKLSPAEIKDYQRRYNEKLAEAYTWDLWGAAYLINGGCSDDGFLYFRGWLISRGRAVYEAAVQDPDTLAGLTDPERDDYEFEELAYLPLEVYEELTGEELRPAVFRSPAMPKGRRWDLDNGDAVSRRLPNLAQVYRA
jgi:hypothetical protein